MRKNLTLSIWFFARLILCAFFLNISLLALSAKHLKAYTIEDVDSPHATIQGRVWRDADPGNGILDADDSGLANVLVKLYTQEGILQRVLTDQQGMFEFSDLATGTYNLEFVAPLDYYFTAGSDSDVDYETRRIENIEVGDTTTHEFLAGVVYDPQRRGPSSISLETFEVSPSALEGSPAIFIEWETSREEGTEGFYIFRSITDSFEQAIQIGDFFPSKGSPTSTDTNRYEHWDINTRQDIIYTYWLQEKERGGQTVEYGPKSIGGLGPGNGDHIEPPNIIPPNFVYLPIIVK